MAEIAHLRLADAPTRVTSTFTEGSGDVPPVVFVHGIALNGTAGHGLVRFFAERGHAIVTVDLPGHGGSDPLPDDQVSMARFGRIVWEVLAHWERAGPVLACGQSAGGMTLLEATFQHPERVCGLLLLSTPDTQPIRANTETDLQPAVQMMIRDSERLFTERKRVDFETVTATGEADFYSLGMRHSAPEGIKGVFKAAESFDVRDKLDRLSVPTVLVRGVDDVIVTRGTVERMAGRLTRGRLVSAPGGHSWFIHQPEALREILRANYEFLVGADVDTLVTIDSDSDR